MFSRRFLIENTTLVSAILLAVYFPTSNFIELPLLAASAFILFPYITTRFILRKPLRHYGINLGDRSLPTSLNITFLAVLITSIIFFIAITTTDTGKTVFRVPASVQNSFPIFLIHTGITFWSIAVNEFFFRGFVLFTWEHISKKVGVFASVIFVAIYAALSTLHTGNVSSWAMFCTTIFLAFGATLVASFTRSIVFSFCFSFTSAILATVFAIFFT